MQQRLGIAQALVADPAFVVLDEPMSGLDPVGRKEMRDLILELKRRGKTVFFSTHILPDVEALCDRVGVIIGGKLRDVGKLDELLSARVKSVEATFAGPGRRGALRRRRGGRARGRARDVLLRRTRSAADAAVRAVVAGGRARGRAHRAPRDARGLLPAPARGRRRRARASPARGAA